MYQGDNESCKKMFFEYMIQKVVNRTEDADNSLKKFYKALLERFSREHSEEFRKSNLSDVLTQLSTK